MLAILAILLEALPVAAAWRSDSRSSLAYSSRSARNSACMLLCSAQYCSVAAALGAGAAAAQALVI